MKALRDYLQQYLRQHPIQEGLNMARLLEHWPELLGEYLSERLIPVSFEKGTLVCQVMYSSLIQELQFLERDILGKLRLFDGGKGIQRLKLVAGAPQRRQNDGQLKQIERARQQRSTPYRLGQGSRPTANELARLERETVSITNPELRERTQQLFQVMIQRQKQLQQQQWRVCQSCNTYYEPGYKRCPYCHGFGHD
jgi:hypothetical protein